MCCRLSCNFIFFGAKFLHVKCPKIDDKYTQPFAYKSIHEYRGTVVIFLGCALYFEEKERAIGGWAAEEVEREDG